MKVSEARDRYLLTMSARPLNTQRAVTQTIGQLTGYLHDADFADWGDDIDLIAGHFRRAHQNFQLKDGNGTLDLRRVHVKAFLDYCHGRRWLPFSGKQILTEVGWTAINAGQRPFLRIPAVQLANILDTQVDPRGRAVLAIAINTGVRASEIIGERVPSGRKLPNGRNALDTQFGLQMKHLNLQEGTLEVYRQKVRRWQTLDMNSDFQEEMVRWVTWYTARLMRQGIAIQPEHYLIPSRALGSGYDPDGTFRDLDLNPFKTFNKPHHVVYDALGKLGIKKTEGDREGIHTLRRSAAIAYYEMFLDSEGRSEALRLTARMLGHQDTVTTEKYLGVGGPDEALKRIVRNQPFLSRLRTPDNVESLDAARKARDAG